MILRLLFVISVLLTAFFVPAFILHIKDMVRWRWILFKELKKIKREKKLFRSRKRKAISLIENKCHALFKTSRVEFSDFEALPDYLISIAGCFHPNAERPELSASLGHILFCLENSFELFDTILKRPGFSKLADVNLQTIKKLRELSSRQPVITSSEKRYLFFNLTTLFYSKYLVVDLHIFLGKLFISIYDQKIHPVTDSTPDDLEAALKDISKIKQFNGSQPSEELLRIKNELVGMPGILTTDPTIRKWKTALEKAALHISSEQFPETSVPIDEAKIGPLLLRTRVWIAKTIQSEGHLLTTQLLKLRLETIFLTKNLSEALLPSPVRKVIMKTQKAYGWVKWPLNVYLWASKGAFFKIALDVGWFAGRKAILVVIFGKSFDIACKELEIVYQESKNR